MCGIIGYVGKKPALPILIDGLKRLEYRGYDSAGLALQGHPLLILKSAGKIASLEARTMESEVFSNPGCVGIAHTRWATHGPPLEKNAHPHADCSGHLAVVHNGIVENYAELKRELAVKGHEFKSDTDTEVLAHLIEDILKSDGLDLTQAVRAALQKVHGTYGLAAISSDEPERIVVARFGSPLVLGIGQNEFFAASDMSAIISYTQRAIFLDDGDLAILDTNGYRIMSLDNLPVEKGVQEIDWSFEDAQKNGQPHFMLKEMLEQPEVLRNSLRGRLRPDEGLSVLGGLRDVQDKLRDLDRLIIVGCGSAYYAGLVGEYMLEEYAGIPVEVELASEFRYRKPIITPKTAVLAVSQSGETADTLAAIREAKMKGALTLGIVNTVGSTIARETDAGVYNHAGPEIGVASTKAFVSQLTIFALLTLYLGRQRQMSLSTGQEIAESLLALPDQIQLILDRRKQIEMMASGFTGATDMLYVGRKYLAPIAYEGALKLKEISYIHAEGYAAGEMKHGPIALINPSFPCLVLCPQDSVYEKTKSNLEELKARGAPLIALTHEGNDEMLNLADQVITIPRTHEILSPILSVIPLQFFAYYLSTAKGIDPDKPRNLAKSVTVE